MNIVCKLACVLSFTLPISLQAQEKLYIETSLGVAFHELELDQKPDLAVTSSGEYASFAIGYALKHTLNLATTLRAWNTEDKEDYSDHALFHYFHFGSLSLGVDAQFFIPSLNQGPYVRAGRHCWAASIYKTVDIWNGSGCSNILSGGLSWAGSENLGGANFVELVLTRFKKLNSWMLVAGHRF